ncbi:hypothetical protein [Nocardiopsis sp. FR6]|uniref:hypothetical protein n=1 Tax=Nocardiopsis sp. FR6 TaxID=2605986 RepID=UPI00135BFB61|nr:hypothetical protein [Nocardiopsis sp. FR6]
MRKPSPAMALAATVTLAASPASGAVLDSEPDYLFIQQHRDALYWWNGTWLPQTLPSGSHIQIQLPATPVHWEPDLGPGCRPTPVPPLPEGVDTVAGIEVPLEALEGIDLPLGGEVTPLGREEFPNEGRNMGNSSTIEAFDFQVSGTGVVAICLNPDPPNQDPREMGLPAGPTDYVLTLLVGVPQTDLF